MGSDAAFSENESVTRFALDINNVLTISANSGSFGVIDIHIGEGSLRIKISARGTAMQGNTLLVNPIEGDKVLLGEWIPAR